MTGKLTFNTNFCLATISRVEFEVVEHIIVID